jgi:hypothetical protein
MRFIAQGHLDFDTRAGQKAIALSARRSIF